MECLSTFVTLPDQLGAPLKVVVEADYGGAASSEQRE